MNTNLVERLRNLAEWLREGDWFPAHIQTAQQAADLLESRLALQGSAGDQLFYGWYDDPDQPKDQPTYNPPFDAPCPYCGKPITTDDIRTHALMATDGYAKRSYFYRTHRTCDERAKERVDHFILNMIAHNGD